MHAIQSSWVALLLALVACNGGPKRASDVQPSQAAAGSCESTSGCDGATSVLHAAKARANASDSTEQQAAGTDDELAAEDAADDSDQEADDTADDTADGDQDDDADVADVADAGPQGKHAEHADGVGHGEHGAKAAHGADAGGDDQAEADDQDETDG